MCCMLEDALVTKSMHIITTSMASSAAMGLTQATDRECDGVCGKIARPLTRSDTAPASPDMVSSLSCSGVYPATQHKGLRSPRLLESRARNQ